MKLIRDSALEAPLMNIPGGLEKPIRQPILINIVLPSDSELEENQRQAAEQNGDDNDRVRANQYIYALYASLIVEQSKTALGSIALSLIKYFLGAQVFAFLTSAAIENGYVINTKTLDQSIAGGLLPESFIDFAANAPDAELDISRATRMAGVIFLVTFKNLTPTNYDGYKRGRHNALTGLLALESADAEWVLEHWPHIDNCKKLRNTLGSSWPMSRTIFLWVKRARSEVGLSYVQRMAEMVFTLMKNDQVTHLFTIFNYVVIPAPAILAHPSLRTEAIRFLAAIQVLEFFAEDQGFIKFLLPVQATTVLSMRNFPLLSRLACRNAQLIDLSFKNYALALDASYNDIL